MKKLITILLVAIILISAIVTFAIGRENSATGIIPDTSTISTSANPIPSPVLETIGIPERLIIDKIGVDVAVEDVGLAPDGRMDIPQNELNAAWYKLGSLPGMNGSAVIAAHFDTQAGNPGVFYRLSELQPGDTIKVITQDNESIEFLVSETKIYKDASFPIEKVFNPNTGPMLNLITCDGVFDSVAQNYSDRLVVFSEKKA